MRSVIGASLALLLVAGSAGAQEPPAVPAAQPEAHPPLPGPAKSARFRLRVGHIFLGLTCPDDEPLKACADFAMQLLDKAQAMQAQEH